MRNAIIKSINSSEIFSKMVSTIVLHVSIMYGASWWSFIDITVTVFTGKVAQLFARC